MTKHIDDFLNIPHGEELEETTQEIQVDEPTNVVSTEEKGNSIVSFVKEDEHTKETDEIRTKALDLQEEIADVARNVEPSRSARMFEVSGQHLKIALDASNSKIKAQLDAAKIKLDAAKLKIDDDMIDGLNSGKEVVADRNALIKELLSEEDGGVIDVEVDEE